MKKEDLEQIRLLYEYWADHAAAEFEKNLNGRNQEQLRTEPRELAGTIFGLLTIGWLFRAVGQARLESRPPFNAEYLLHLLLKRGERDEVVGDLVEGYNRVSLRFGKRRADIWFYKQVAGSLWPLLRRAIVKIGALVSLGKVLRRLIS